MKFLIVNLLIFAQANATTLTVVNNTGDKMRIVELHDRCGNQLVSRAKPVFLKNGEKVLFTKANPVIHTYEICGSGFCSSTGLSFKKDAKEGTLNVILDDGMISGQMIPEVWPGNMECN
jgi:hypothetical protein